MINGSFDVRVDTPKTFKRGTVTFSGTESALVVTLADIEGFDGSRLEGTCTGREFSLAGVLDRAGRDAFEYDISGSMWGNSIEAQGATSLGKVEVRGTSVSSATGDSAGQPRSMYAGRWSDGY